jgi:hypothetical protein
MTVVPQGERRRGGAKRNRSRAWARVPARIEPSGDSSEADPLSASAFTLRYRQAMRWGAERGGRLASCAPYTDRPPSLADVVTYVRAGGFVPGEQPWWVEAPGYVYGAVVAVPFTAAGYAVIWTVQRPTRLLLVLYVLALVAAAWFAPTLMAPLLLAPLLPLGIYVLLPKKGGRGGK